MVDNCIVAGGEPSSQNNGKATGVKNIVAQSESVLLKNAVVGNVLTLNNSTSGNNKAKDQGHCGIITELTRNKEGKITTLKMIDSGGRAGSGKSGPRTVSVISNGKRKYYGKRITGVHKWDKRPDMYKGGTLKQVNIIGSRVNNFTPYPFVKF